MQRAHSNVPVKLLVPRLSALALSLPLVEKLVPNPAQHAGAQLGAGQRNRRGASQQQADKQGDAHAGQRGSGGAAPVQPLATRSCPAQPQHRSRSVSVPSPGAPLEICVGVEAGVVLFLVHRSRSQRKRAPQRPASGPAPEPTPGSNGALWMRRTCRCEVARPTPDETESVFRREPQRHARSPAATREGRYRHAGSPRATITARLR